MNHFRTLSFAALMAMSVPTVAVAQTELIFNSYLPPFNGTFQSAIRDFSKDIMKEAGGSLTINIPDSSLAPANRQYEMVRDGIADMAIVATGSVSQFVTFTEIAELPLHSPTAEAASVALWETYNEHFKAHNELQGVIILSTHALVGRQLLSVSDLAAEVPGDIKGAKIWATADPLVAAAEGMGGIPIDTEFSELQEYVTKGNLDALFIGPGSADGAKVLDRVTHITNIPGGYGSVSFMVIISEERWNELDEDQQAAMLRAADGLPRRTGAKGDAEELEVAEVVANIPTSNPTGAALAEFEAILAPQTDEWMERAAAKGLENPQEVVDFYRSVLARETGM